MEKHEVYLDGNTIDHKIEYYYNANSPNELIATKTIYNDNYYTDYVV